MQMRLVFLRDGGFYFNTGVRAYWTNELDKDIVSILRSTAKNAPPLKHVISLQIVTQPGGKPSSLISYCDDNGKVWTYHTVKHSHPKLADWLAENSSVIANLQISLGPKGQFFASSSLSCQWSGADSTLQENIHKLTDGHGGWKPERAPDRVLFGTGDSHLITCKGGRYLIVNPTFVANYPKLYGNISKRVSDRSVTFQYKYITMNPYVEDGWLVIWGDGVVEYNNLPRQFHDSFAGIVPWLRAQDAEAASSSHRVSTSSSRPSSSASSSRPVSQSSSVRPYSRWRPSPRPSYYAASAASPPTPNSGPYGYAKPAAYTTPSLVPSAHPTSVPSCSVPLQGHGPQQSIGSEMMHLVGDLNQLVNNSSDGWGSGGSGVGATNSMFSSGGFGPINNMLNGGGQTGLNSVGFDPSSFMGLMGSGMGFGC